MSRLGEHHWNALLAAVLLGGLLFIVGTRVRPELPVQVSGQTTPRSAAPAPVVGHPAPDFALVDQDGNPVALSALRGQVVLVNIWATWCPPCRAEMPAIQSVYARYRDEGFTVLAVNQREEASVVVAYLEEHGLEFAAPLDVDGRVSDAYRASLLPSSFFIDRAGIVRAVYRGPMARSVIAGTVEQLLAEE